MKFKKLVLLVLSLALTYPTLIMAAQIDTLQQQLNQLDQAIQAMPNGNPKQAQEYVNQLISIANQLKTIRVKDQAWKRAATDYNRLNQLAVSKARTAPKHLANQAADASTLSALKSLAQIESRYQQMTAGDINAANQMLTELKALIPAINHAKNKYHPKWQELRKKYNQLNNDVVAKAKQTAASNKVTQTPNSSDTTKAIQTSSTQGINDLPSYMQARFKRIKRIKRNIDGTTSEINQISNADLTNPQTVTKLKQRIQRQLKDLAKLEPQNNPAIVNLIKQLNASQQLLAQKQQSSQASVAGFGDIISKIAQIDQNMQKIRVPKALVTPVDAATISTYIQQVQAVDAHIQNDLAYLQKIDGKTQLVKPDTMSRLKHWIGRKPNDLKQSLSASKQAIDAWVERYMGRLKHLNAMHHEQRKDRLQLLQRDYLEKTLAELEEGIKAIKAAKTFDQAAQREHAPNREKQVMELQHTMREMQQKFDLALQLNTMRKPQSTSAKLLKIARDTLAKPKYGVNAVERMVINYDLHSKQKKETVVEEKTLVTYFYKWDEFQVTTAEKVGDKYYLFSNMFKYYYSGNNVTPTNRWILSNRFEGMQILSGNIHK